jgi:hypothetical protein
MTNEFWDTDMRTFEPFVILLMSALTSIPAVAQTTPPPPLDYVVVADSFSLRRTALTNAIPYYTTVAGARAAVS